MLVEDPEPQLEHLRQLRHAEISRSLQYSLQPALSVVAI
jgi:hypothetical protein